MNTPSGRFSRYPAVNRTPAEPAPEVLKVPDFAEMTAREVLAWAGDDDERIALAIEGEGDGRGRTTLLRDLRNLVG